MLRARRVAVVLAMFSTTSLSQSSGTARIQDRSASAAIRGMAGCYLVDYSYTETEGLQPEYVRDARVYDVNKDKSIKEWIYSEEISSTRIRLQHVLFGTTLSGTVLEDSLLKHQVEDWNYDASHLYEFIAPLHWIVRDLSASREHWTRRITSLDEGLRYQCAAPWNLANEYPEWSCDNFAPVPGRETRDMGRRDYNTMDRSTRLVLYGTSWLERQANTKVNHEQSGARVALAKELGKNWYVRLPDSECGLAQAFAQPRQAFWGLLREAWDEVLTGDRPFTEKALAEQPSRYAKILDIEERYYRQDLSVTAIRLAAKNEILAVIEEYREN